MSAALGERLRTATMVLVRLVAGGLVAARYLVVLAGTATPLAGAVAAPLRYGLAAALAAGLALFAWPRTCLPGCAWLVAALLAAHAAA
ncbi:MAG: hypothetical protein JSR54_18085, partial [Proteobacteria bacterium]|nr:hypothetical protein [Pseudomonadota bacterium]